MKFLWPSKEVAIMGSQYQNLGKDIQRNYHFNTIFVGSEKVEYLALMHDRFQGHKSSIYVCKSRTCSLPVFTTSEALQLLGDE